MVIMAASLFRLAVSIELEKLTADTVNYLAATSTVIAMRDGFISDEYVAREAVKTCFDSSIMKSGSVVIDRVELPSAGGDAEDISLTLRYDMGFTGFLALWLGDPVSSGTQKAWIDDRISRDAIIDNFMKHVGKWQENLTGGGGDDDGTEDLPGRVYVTNTGKKYHRKWCNCLRFSAREIPLTEAMERGYGPCQFCILKTADIIGYPLGPMVD